MANILCENEVDTFDLSEQLWQDINHVVDEVIREEGFFADAEVSLTFVDNTAIHELNLEYRGKDMPTDVLSFPLFERGELDEMIEKGEHVGNLSLGDIVISLDKAAAQAEEFGHSFQREVCFLLCHSMFHLFGYDHDTEENTQQMRRKEEAILQKLGIDR